MSRSSPALRLIAIATLVLSLATPANAEDQSWHFTLTPYIWLPNIEGAGDADPPPAGGGSPEFEIGPVDYLDNLDFVLMLAGEARKGDWAFRADVVYVDFGNQRSAVKSVTGPGGAVEIPVDAGTKTSLDGLVSQITAGYRVIESPSVTFEAIGGFRYFDLSFTLDWEFDGPLNQLPQSGSTTQDAGLWDAIVGTRGRFTFANDHWIVPFHLDAGAGDSELTWQAFVGVGYAFSWGDLIAAYRHLEYDQKNGELLQGIRISGPTVGASFRF
jgi:hypothetical protein